MSFTFGQTGVLLGLPGIVTDVPKDSVIILFSNRFLTATIFISSASTVYKSFKLII